MLCISNYVFSTNLLGPYNRFVVWVHGCCFSCPGCILENSESSLYKEISAEDLSFEILQSSDIEGITISGGEPFLQAAELVSLINVIKSQKDLGVIIYTGFTIEELQKKNDPKINELLNLTDVLIDGRYIKEMDDGKAYRGSSNQRIIPLTQRYDDILDEYYDSYIRKSEIIIGLNSVSLVGVPDKKDLENWKKIKNLIQKQQKG